MKKSNYFNALATCVASPLVLTGHGIAKLGLGIITAGHLTHNFGEQTKTKGLAMHDGYTSKAAEAHEVEELARKTLAVEKFTTETERLKVAMLQAKFECDVALGNVVVEQPAQQESKAPVVGEPLTIS